jgi:transcriptional repressor NrdR
VDRKHIDLIVASIHQQLQGSIENEVTSETIGKLVMTNLSELDKVAFVRFASVYQNFNKVEDFERFAGAVRTEYPI